jgi:TolA-binding protein
MQRLFTLRHRSVAAAVLTAILVLMPVRAHAASKEIIALQTQVQQLLDMMQRMQSTLDTKFGVLQHLVEQTADNANQMNATVNTLQQKLNQQNEGLSGKIDTASGQVQSLNDSVDELKSRIAKLDKSIQDLQGQLQNIQSAPSGTQTAPGGSALPSTVPPSTNPGPDNGAPAPSAPPQPNAAAPASNPAPPLKETFQAGLRDFNAAKYTVATGEFQDVVHYYPMDDLSGSSQFYLGEIAYRQQDYAEAIKDYNAVLEGFSGNPKAPAAQLHKGYALIQQGKRDAGIHELRLLVQRHPQTPEGTQARAKLTSMGVHSTTAAAQH